MMITRKVIPTAALLCLSLFMPVARAEIMPVTQVEGIAEFKLDNGMKVLLFHDESKPTVTVNITYFVGSRHEGYGEAGMAHLLEHMLFKGTPTHEDIPQLLKDRGAQLNGTTWLDRTNYYETLPASAENLEFALQLEADRMINSKVAAEDLQSEFSAVRTASGLPGHRRAGFHADGATGRSTLQGSRRNEESVVRLRPVVRPARSRNSDADC